MPDFTPPTDPEDTITRLTAAAGNGDCVRIASLALALHTSGATEFTRDDILNEWLNTWPYHNAPPFKRRPAQRMNVAYPVVFATGMLEVVDDDANLRRINWPTIVTLFADRLPYAIQKEQSVPNGIDVAIPVDDDLVAAIVAAVGALTGGGEGGEMGGEMTLSATADVVKGPGR